MGCTPDQKKWFWGGWRAYTPHLHFPLSIFRGQSTLWQLATTHNKSESLSTIICTVLTPTPHHSMFLLLNITTSSAAHSWDLFSTQTLHFFEVTPRPPAKQLGQQPDCLLALLLGSKCQRWSSQKMFVRLEASFLRVKLVSNVCIVVCSCVKLSFFPTFFLDVCLRSNR